MRILLPKHYLTRYGKIKLVSYGWYLCLRTETEMHRISFIFNLNFECNFWYLHKAKILIWNVFKLNFEYRLKLLTFKNIFIRWTYKRTQSVPMECVNNFSFTSILKFFIIEFGSFRLWLAFFLFDQSHRCIISWGGDG